jgi:hypothetical protein
MSLNTKILFEDWQKKYNPIINTNNPNEEIFFETFGEDFDTVRQSDPTKVWSEVEDDYGDLVILPGFHFVNRMRYYLTEKSYDENIEIIDSEYITNNQAILYCQEINKKLDLGYSTELILRYFNGEDSISVSKAEHIAITMFEENGDISESDVLKINNYYSMLK